MLALALMLVFMACCLVVLGLNFDVFFPRPTLKLHEFGSLAAQASRKPEARKFSPLSLVRWLAVFNKPLVSAEMRRNMSKNIALLQMGMTPEEYVLVKEMSMAVLVWCGVSFLDKDLSMLGVLMGVAGGWVLPDIWLRGKVGRIKEDIVKQLPDTVDLLGLCVNAGLDFMMALKWVVEKSSPTVLVGEMNNVLQEINVGKPRRDALRDLAQKYEIPDLSTFARTLIQADKMGTSVSEALNILSEDMRLARFRRGEAMALKAPLKMLVPLLFCIFPVVGILVGAPIFLDFMYNNPLKNLGR